MTPDVGARPLWRGRALAVVGILLCAFSLRSAVASLSPLIGQISADFPLSPTVLGLIGTAPPVCFAIFGLATPSLERRLGLERVMLVALSAIVAGLVLRGLSVDAVTLMLTTALIFAGVGMGNILVPPLVKKYFPDRLGLMMTLYTTMMSVSTFLPPLVAVPVADASTWRVSLGMWGVFALAGLLPWIIMLVRARTETMNAAPAPSRAGTGAELDPVTLATGPIQIAPTGARVFARLARLPLAWSIAIVFSASSTMAYVSFAWLPSIVTGVAGVDATTAGLLLSLFAFMGLPSSLIVPVLVVRFQATRAIFLVAAASGLLGIIGLLFFANPVTVWIWVALFGLLPMMFPLALVLISIRARTPESAVGLSSFVQSVGYLLAAAFPFLVGMLHDATDAWTAPLLLLAAVVIASIPFGLIAARRRTVEDEWESRHGRW